MEHASFLDFLNAGSLSFTPFCVIDGAERAFETELFTSGRTMRISCRYADGFTDELYLTRDTSRGILCRRLFTNRSGKAIHLTELGLRIGGITFGKNPKKDYFYHNENPRIYQRLTFPVDYSRTVADANDTEYDLTAGNRWADPGVVDDRIGRSPYQPFPAIHVGNYETNHGIVHGTLSQKLFYHNYLLSHENDTVTMDIYSSFKAIAYLDMADGRTLTDEWWLGSTENAGDIERVFEDYTAVLRTRLPANYGATNINRNAMVWGSWNDGNFRNISEEMLLKEASYLAENVPIVKWFQLDDGYAVDTPPAFGLGMPYEGEAGVDYNKFPNGLKHYSDAVRALGLRPALWIGGLCAKKTKIGREKPEWFCDYSFRLTDQSPLDVSKPVVRDYITHALDVLLTEYGFDAVKHDFWSYAFEDSHDLLANKTESGYYYRDWWLKEMRRRLPSDGYLQTGCDIVMGNPFLGEFFTNYRYGIDIGNGNWENVRTNFLWGIACFATHTGDLIVPNSDSVGLFPGLDDTDAMFALNYCLVTHSMVEIAGNLSKCDPENPRLKILRKAVCNVNNGQDVYLANYNYRAGVAPLPSTLYFKTPHFSVLEGNKNLPCATVGLFNTGDAELDVKFRAGDLGLDESAEYELLNVWTQEQYAAGENGEFAFELPVHGSMLLAVIKKGETVLADADIQVVKAEAAGDALEVTFGYKAPAELKFTKEVKAVTVKGEPAAFRNEGGFCKLTVDADSYRFVF